MSSFASFRANARNLIASPTKIDPSLAFGMIAVLLLLIHWANQLLVTYGLMYDEAQYWFWGKNLDFGYYSKPPMIAWLMGFSTSLFGDNVFGAKMLAPLIHLAVAFILYRTASLLKHEKPVAAWVAVTYLTLPVITMSSAFLATDSPLIFFWALGIYGVVNVLGLMPPQTPQLSPPHTCSGWNRLTFSAWFGWFIIGAAIGFGMLSKYTMIAFVASLGLLVLIRKDYRGWLLKPTPYLAALLSLLIFAPNIWWNMQHQFVTLQHTEDNVFSKNILLYPHDMLEFAAAQFVVFGPILMVALLWKARSGTIAFFFWPIVVMGLVVSLLAGAQAHWIAPAYLAGTLMVVPWLYAHARNWLKASLALHLLLLGLFYALPSLPLKRDFLVNHYVWGEVAPEVKMWQQKYPDALLLADDRKLSAALTYALRNEETGAPHLVYKWNPSQAVHDHYDLLTQKIDLKGKELLFIARNPESIDAHGGKLLAQFNHRGKDFYVFYMPAFRGFE